MSSKGVPLLAMMFLMIASVLTGLIFLDEAEGAAPVFSSVSFDPEDPSFEDDINVTVIFSVSDETISSMSMQVCHEKLDGTDALCEAPVAMTDTGDGETFFAIIPRGGYGSDADGLFYSMHFMVMYGSGSSLTYPANPDSHEVNITVLKKATRIMVDASPDKTTIYPNETITVSGKVTDDLDENVTEATVNLTVVGEGIENSTLTDISGDFDVSVLIPSDGNYTINLTAEKDGMMAYDEWEIIVNSWPIPDIELEGGVWLDVEDVLPADPYEFYTGDDVSITYEAENAGTGTAYNVTVVINTTGMDEIRIKADGNLTPPVAFGGWEPFNTSTPGDYTVTITVEYDQEAPEEFRQPVDPVIINISISDPPTWEDHRVLVEMFTQTTCGPCVVVEEALERLHAEEILDFDFIVYVFDDTPSKDKATELGVSATPDLFVDHTYDRKTGSGDLVSLRAEMISMIENASARDTPPLDLDMSESNGTTNVSLSLRSIYAENVSGILQVQLVEAHSNMRNLQGIPIANRFLETLNTVSVADLSPGSEVFTEVPSPGKGEGLIAVLYDDTGKVLQTASMIPEDRPEVYMKEDSDLFRTDSPVDLGLVLDIEKFQYDDSVFDDIMFGISAGDLPEGWNLTLGDVELGTIEYDATFSHDTAQSKVLNSTRVRFNDSFVVTVEVPEGANGTFSFHVDVNSSGFVYSHTVVIIATPENGPVVEEPSLDSVYMKKEGGILYLFANASNVPDGAVLKGRILPCDYGEGAACGLPVDVDLVEYETGRYRADTTSVDLETYTHLTYSVWIEKDGTQMLVSQETTEEISQLIGSSPVDGDGEEDDNSTLFIVIAAVVVLLIIIIIVVLLISGRNREELSGEE